MENMSTENEKITFLKGTKQNPATDPMIGSASGNPKDIGTKAFNDSLMLVVIGWILLILLAYSLRHHNI